MNLIVSVNVDRDLARKERAGLLAIAAARDAEGRKDGRRCLVCGGHGPGSALEGGSPVTSGAVEHYRPDRIRIVNTSGLPHCMVNP